MRSRMAARSSTGNGRWLITAAILVLGALGTAVALAASGYWSKPPTSRVGLVAVPKSVRPLKAFQRVTREDVYDLTRGDDSYFWFPKARIESNPDWMLTVDKVVGRVMARDKAVDFVFSEKDFLPEGSRPGLVGGIPPGKRAMIVPGEQLQGLQHLQRGDRFDLFATVAARRGDSAAPLLSQFSERDGVTGGLRHPESVALDLQKKLGIRLLVRNGAVVDNSVRPQSGRVPAAPARDLTIAVDPGEIVSLTHALGAKQSIFCAARSGQPEVDDSDDLASPDLAGLVPCVLRSVAIPAYTEISASHLVDRDLGQPAVLYFRKEEIEPGWMPDARELIGRVAARDLRPGFVFQEADLLPKGSAPGVAGAIPSKHVGMSLNVGQVTGLRELLPGDRFALLAQLGETVAAPAARMSWASIQGGVPDPKEEELESELRSGVKRFADNVLKISDSGDSCVVAVPERDSAAVAQAVAKKLELRAIVRARETRLDPSGAETETEANATDHPTNSSKTSVPVLAKRVAAHERISLEHFLDPATGRPRLLHFPVDRVEANWITSLPELVDRVAGRSIEEGYVVKESDLLPAGTPPGTAAGIPVGQVGVVVSDDDVSGLADLGEGDVIALMTARRIDLDSGGLTWQSGLNNGSALELLGRSVPNTSPEVVLLTRQALVLSVTERTVLKKEVSTIVTETGLARETRTIPQPIERRLRVAVLALPPEDAGAVGGAVASETPIFAILRSSNSLESSGDFRELSEQRPLGRAVVIEHIRGLARVRRDVWPAAR
jgi:hypothetical protein